MASPLRTLALAVALFGLGATSPFAADALAGPPGPPDMEGRAHHRGPKMPGAGLARAMSQLDLTADQQAALESIRDDLKGEMRGHRDERQADKDGWLEALRSGEIDRAAVHADIDTRAAERLALSHQVLDRVLDVYDSLTPEQKLELVEVIEDHEAEMSERGARGARGRDARNRPDRDAR